MAITTVNFNKITAIVSRAARLELATDAFGMRYSTC